MKREKMEVVIGALLHDTGKLLFRDKETKVSHSLSGAQWVRDAGIENEEIIRQIRYHHSKEIRESTEKIPDSSLAYITYWADNVAAGADRRDSDEIEITGSRYERSSALESVFNILNGNADKKVYNEAILSDDGSINYPIKEKKEINSHTYAQIIDNIKDSISGMDISEEYLNSLLEVLEANIAYVPSSTDQKQICDISLYDHVKLTAAIASAVHDYLSEKQIDNYRETLFTKGKDFYDEKCFMLCSMDISGIQNFIYTIAVSRALKNLRARSFYLEIMMEHIVDQILSGLELTRANLIYTGGGHAYILMPNTDKCRTFIKDYTDKLNKWLMSNFGIDLYMAVGFKTCSGNILMNKSEGSYRKLFREVASELSAAKANRYSADDIKALNNNNTKGDRECVVCGRSSNLVDDNKCEICDALEHIATELIEKDFVVILSERPKDNALLLPDDCYMVMKNRSEVTSVIKDDGSYIRCYGKNKRFVGNKLATKLWVGDYSSDKEFGILADKATGIRRLGVLRADVDNLGKALIAGFDERNLSISRTTTFSRKLSEFFKFHINYILRNPVFTMDGIAKEYRNALIVYSGGDDVFLIGAWDDVVEFAVDLSDSLKEYAQKSLTISAGIGLYPAKYPVSTMAYETGLLEDNSKSMDGKNAITLFDKNNAYNWDDFKDRVVGEKLNLLQRYFQINASEKGNSFLYKLLEYIRSIEDDVANANRINLARYAYLLARIRPKNESDEAKEAIYREFAEKMYEWIKSPVDRGELISAIYIYVYMNRNRED